MTKMLALFFGEDEVTFTVTSNHPLANPNSRTYSRFSDMAADVVEVRILQGIHFRSADEAGRALGTKVARWSFHHILGPLHGGWGVQEDFDDDDL
jgi:hypothetical protein